MSQETMTDEERFDKCLDALLENEDWISEWVEENQELIVGCILRSDEYMDQFYIDTEREADKRVTAMIKSRNSQH